MLNKPSLAVRYSCAPVAIALAIWIRLLLDPVIGDQIPYATLFLAVLVVAAYSGLGPALVAIVLGAFSVAYFVLPPRGTFRLERRDEAVGVAFYIITSLGIALLGGMNRNARRRAEGVAREAQQQA